MRVLLFLIIVLVAGYSLMDLFGILNKSREVNPLKRKVGIEKVKVPKELKDEYIKIAKNEKKLFLKEKSGPIIIKKNKINFTQNKDFPLKIKDKRTHKDILIIDAYIKNNTSKTYKGKMKILCKTYDKNAKETDIFSWKGNVKINPDKVILLKGIKLGYINVENTKYIRCKVDNFKRY